MEQKNAIKLFEDKKIRTAWDEEQEKWYFSIVDACEVLSGTDNPRRYWSDLKRKLKKEGAEQLYEKIVQLKLQSTDGKFYKTNVADTKQLLRLIQSIPSPKAEPFKSSPFWKMPSTLSPAVAQERTVLPRPGRICCG